jgi:hypothetical protein
MTSVAAAKSLLVVGFLLMMHPCEALSIEESSERNTTVVTEFSYHSGPSVPLGIARGLALYGAKYEAVAILIDRVAGGDLLNDFWDQHREVFCLLASQLPFTLIDESFSQEDLTYTVKIESRLSLTDYLRAEMVNAALDSEESRLSLQEEMAPLISPETMPGYDLSKAYRYIRKQRWRMAIIYIDHLEKKYSDWGDLLFAKAIAFRGMNETEKADGAFRSACHLGNHDACMAINGME